MCRLVKRFDSGFYRNSLCGLRRCFVCVRYSQRREHTGLCFVAYRDNSSEMSKRDGTQMEIFIEKTAIVNQLFRVSSFSGKLFCCMQYITPCNTPSNPIKHTALASSQPAPCQSCLQIVHYVADTGSVLAIFFGTRTGLAVCISCIVLLRPSVIYRGSFRPSLCGRHRFVGPLPQLLSPFHHRFMLLKRDPFHPSREPMLLVLHQGRLVMS